MSTINCSLCCLQSVNEQGSRKDSYTNSIDVNCLDFLHGKEDVLFPSTIAVLSESQEQTAMVLQYSVTALATSNWEESQKLISSREIKLEWKMHVLRQ